MILPILLGSKHTLYGKDFGVLMGALTKCLTGEGGALVGGERDASEEISVGGAVILTSLKGKGGG